MPSNTSEVVEPQSPVPPGNLTGIYYIVVAGLPWNTSWQSLKDFTRKSPDGTKINVDHVMVYPRSTDGWVRIKGRSEFYRALVHLTRGLLKNRAIIADGRNEEEWTMLRAMNVKKSSQLPQPTPSSHGLLEARSKNLHLTPPPSPMFWPRTQLPTRIPCMPFLPGHEMTSPQISPCVSHDPMSAPEMGPARISTHQIPAVQLCQPQLSPFQMAAPQQHPCQLSSSQISPQSPIEPGWHWEPTPVIHTEAKKTIIKKLGTSVTESSLKILLRTILSHHDPEHLTIQIPRNSTHVPRGYAFVTFPSYDTAKRAINALNGLPLGGQFLVAGFVKEGFVPKKKHGPHKGRKSMKIYAGSSCSFNSSSSTVVAPRVVSEDTNYTLCSSPSQTPLAPPPRSTGTPMVVVGSSIPGGCKIGGALAV